MTEFLNGEVSVYLIVLSVIPGRQLSRFLGLVLCSIKILSLLCVDCFCLVYYLTLKVLNDFVLLGASYIVLSTELDTGCFSLYYLG